MFNAEANQEHAKEEEEEVKPVYKVKYLKEKGKGFYHCAINCWSYFFMLPQSAAIKI